MSELIPVNTNPVKLFTENGLEPILNEIKKKVDEFEPDVESGAGRKEIAAFAYKIAQSKTFIEKAGKELVSKQKAEIKLIDTERKRSRDFLDEQRDRARLPLTKWEEAEKKALEEEEGKIRFEADYTEALEFHALWLKEKELEALKAKIEKEEEEKREAVEAERLEKERIEREERLKKEAAEKAIRETQEAAEKERQELLKNEREAKEAVEKAERDRIAAEERAKIEKETAVQKAKQEAEHKARVEKEEAERKAVEEKAKADKKARHYKHRLKIESEAYGSFIKLLGCTNKIADEIVDAIKNNKIKNVTLNY